MTASERGVQEPRAGQDEAAGPSGRSSEASDGSLDIDLRELEILSGGADDYQGLVEDLERCGEGRPGPRELGNASFTQARRGVRARLADDGVVCV